MKKLIVFILALTVVLSSQGQSIISDPENNGFIVGDDLVNGVVSYDSKGDRLSLQYKSLFRIDSILPKQDTIYRTFTILLNPRVSGTGSNGQSTIFSEEEFSPGAELGLNVAFKLAHDKTTISPHVVQLLGRYQTDIDELEVLITKESDPAKKQLLQNQIDSLTLLKNTAMNRELATLRSRGFRDLWFYGNAKYKKESFDLLTISTPTSFMFSDTTFAGGSWEVGLQRTSSVNKRLIAWRLGAEFGRTNNGGNLPVQRVTNQISQTDTTSFITSSSSWEQSGRIGKYNESRYQTYSADFYFVPFKESTLSTGVGGVEHTSNIGFHGFFRWNVNPTNSTLNFSNVGIGMYGLSNSKPLSPVVGLVLQANDVFDDLNNENNFTERLSVHLKLSIPLPIKL